MKITPDEVARIARLARLDLPADKLDLFAHQLGDVLTYMELLAEVDTSQVEPLYSPVDHPAPTRADEPACECSREDILANAPAADGRFFIVPRIV